MPEAFSLDDHPHRRLNALTGEWVLVSPHRAKRPWQGKRETHAAHAAARRDPACYLCPGNQRAGSARNPEYTGPYAFTNDFSALLPDVPDGGCGEGSLLQARGERGLCRVICFSPRHDLTLPELEPADIERVIGLWREEYRALAGRPWIRSILIFENKGETMGCSNPHPHGQIWAQSTPPEEMVKESARQKSHYERTGRTLLADYLAAELEQGKRIVCSNERFVALVPFWAVWPFETMIVSRRSVPSLLDFDPAEDRALADILKRLTARYDNLFCVSFPYSAGMHQSPVNDGGHPEWHWHMHFYPPLLRSATVRKFMVGYEMLANPQRDITPERAAATLRELPQTHYKTADRAAGSAMDKEPT
ncbi:MAG TPA: galactose-1-phosphate uridylyltransferase [Elusimicrobia bacterium]|nr:galactose-1-phosphate uridylyltransferase [Elusimicrobiota bacterium]HBT60572.1 galactose-1-phosphate uridylyltransferase [Elusimicrobiota bacterium]